LSDVNPAGQCPALELDDGGIVTEITAICEYIEDVQPEPVLIGATAVEKAETRMWTRRIDLNIAEPLTNGFRYSDGLDFFTPRFRCIPEAADGLKAVAQDKIAWLDGLMAGKSFVAGDRFTLADVMLFVFLEFGERVGQPVPEACQNIKSWYARIAERPSASA
jgi:glutathione S-transferase